MGNNFGRALDHFDINCLNPPDRHLEATEVNVNNFTTRIPDNFKTAIPPPEGAVEPFLDGLQTAAQTHQQPQRPRTARADIPGQMQAEQPETSWSPLAWLMEPAAETSEPPRRKGSSRPPAENQQGAKRASQRRKSEPPPRGEQASPSNGRATERSMNPRGTRDQERNPREKMQQARLEAADLRKPAEAQPDVGSNTFGLTAENLRATRDLRGSFAGVSEFGGQHGGLRDSFTTNFALAGSFASRPPGSLGSFAIAGQQPGAVACTTQPPQGVSTQLPGGSSFVGACNTQPPAGCTTQPPMQGIATQLPPGMANGRASFAGSSIASQAGSFSHGGSFAIPTGNTGMRAQPGRPAPAMQKIRE